jgi:hypothetical protein
MTALTLNFPFSERERTRKHAKYPKLLRAYAATYEVSIHTISSWVQRGKLKGELPPLPNRAAMAEWLWRYYGTRRTAGYPKSLSHYAIRYATTPRSIKRWIRRGKHVGDLPPLDDVAATRRWVARRMKRHGPSHFPVKDESSKNDSDHQSQFEF